MRDPGKLTGAEVLRKARAEALGSHWELALLQQMRAERLPVPEREFHFSKTRGWAFDFAWPDPHLVAVEVEGGTGKRGVPCGRCRGGGSIYAHGYLTACTACGGRGRLAGRHNSADGYERDAEKYNEAQAHGWKVFRFTSQMIKDGRAIRFLCDDIFKMRRTP